jgi:hypothetical protein
MTESLFVIRGKSFGNANALKMENEEFDRSRRGFHGTAT